VDTTPINKCLQQIRKCLRVLRGLQPMTYEAFVKNYLYTDTAEHNFQIAIQAALDIASIILADQAVKMPRDYKDPLPRPG